MKAVAPLAIGVAVAIAVPALAPALASAIGVSTGVATAMLGVGLSLAATLTMKALGLTPKARSSSSRDATPTMFRQAITESHIVYGRRRVGGLLTFFHARQSGDDHYRYFVITVAGHRCQGNPVFMLNDEIVSVDGNGKVTSGPYANAAWLWFDRGTADATAHPVFVTECGGKWTANHRGRGVAKIYAKFEMTDEVIQAGMPNMTVIIDGKDNLRDPRDGSIVYSTNATIVTYDFLQMPREEGGWGAWPEEIPDDSVLSAWANVCDENVTVPGGTEKRYALEGLIVTGTPPGETLDELILNQAGASTYSEGKMIVRPGYYVPVSHPAITEGQLKGPIRVSAFDEPDEAANEVHGTFVDPDANFQGAPFPAQIASADAANVQPMDLDLAWCTSIFRGQRIALIMLRRAQADKSFQLVTDISTLAISALDTIQIATARYGIHNYAWQVRSWGLTPEYMIGMQVREENAEIYEPPVTYGTVSAAEAITKPGRLLTKGEKRQAIRTCGIITGGSNPLSAVESGGSVTITVADFEVDYPGIGKFSCDGAVFADQAPDASIWAYFEDPAVSGGAVTIGLTTSWAEAKNSDAHPFRREIDVITTPASGSGGGSGGGGIGGEAPPPGESWP